MQLKLIVITILLSSFVIAVSHLPQQSGLNELVSGLVASPSRTLLLEWCRYQRERNVTFAAARSFSVEKRFDFSAEFAKLQHPANGWGALAEAARVALVSRGVNHSLLSSKVKFRNLFRKASGVRIPDGVAFDASELVDASSDARLNSSIVGNCAQRSRILQGSPIMWLPDARRKICNSVRDVLLLPSTTEVAKIVVKPAHCVQAFGRSYHHIPSNSGDDFVQSSYCGALVGAVVDALNCVSIDDAFHMHSPAIEPGVIIQKMFDDGNEDEIPLLPRLLRWMKSDFSVLELKVMTLFGQTVVVNPRSVPFLHYLLPTAAATAALGGAIDKAFQDENGNVFFEASTSSRDFSWALRHLPQVEKIAESIARASGISALRVDFFVHRSNGVIELNEIEVVSGEMYGREGSELDECMGSLWREPMEARKFKVVSRSDEQIAADIVKILV